jgi:RHS repeat-associated protein
MRFWTSTSNSGALPYRYNGKELEAMNGLNEYDYGARRRETGIPVWKTMDPLCEIDYSISPYAYAHDNFINRIDPNGMKDGDVDGGTLQEILCTAPTLQNNGNNYSAFQQLLDYANRNTPQIPRMTPPTPSFNLSVNPNNQTTNDKQTKPKNKEMSDVLKQISAQLYVLGISEASVEVIETSVKGVPTISILFKGEAAFANLAKLTPALKALGPIGFALNLVVDAGKVTNNDESKLKAGVNIAVGVISLWFPEVGIVYMILDHYGAFDGAPINLPNYQPNSICPQDAIRTVIPNYTH